MSFLTTSWIKNINKLHLNACGGVSDQIVKSIEWLNLGVAVCGRVAQEGQRIIAENIQGGKDKSTDLVRSLGIQAYCCHPLIGNGEVLGTLSFGSKLKKDFSDEDITMMKIVADFVAISMTRLIDEEKLLKSQRRANERAEELEKMMNIVPSAIWIAQDPQCLEITGNATANSFYEAKEGENVSLGLAKVSEGVQVRRFFCDGKELTAEELTMQVAASSGKDVLNSELEVLLPSGRRMTMLGNASPPEGREWENPGLCRRFYGYNGKEKS